MSTSSRNRMLRHQIKGRVRLSDGERKTLAEIGQKLGKQPSRTWRRSSSLIRFLAGTEARAQKFTALSSVRLRSPMIDQEVEDLVCAWRRRIVPGV